MSTFSTPLRHVYFFHTVSPCQHLPHGCTMSSFFQSAAPCLFSTLLRHVYFFPRCCLMSTLSTLLFNVYVFNAAAPCLLFPHCCTMSTSSTRLRHVFFFPICCAMSTFSTLLCQVFFYQAAASCLLIPLLRHVYLFHAVTLCLLFSRCFALSVVDVYSIHTAAPCFFPHSCAMSPFSMLLCHVYIFHMAAPSCLLVNFCTYRIFLDIIYTCMRSHLKWG